MKKRTNKVMLIAIGVMAVAGVAVVLLLRSTMTVL
mgnify:CR=1 FL=1